MFHVKHSLMGESGKVDNDVKLVQKLKKHDQKAFEKIVDKFAPFAATVIHNVSNASLTKEDIEEAVMDTFITLWKNADKVQEDKLKGYIACIAKSKAKNKIAALKRVDMINIDEVDPEDDFSISEKFEAEQLENDILDILSTFKQQDREIFLRHYFYYQKLSDISEITGLTLDNVKVKLFRTRNKLKQALIERGYSI